MICGLLERKVSEIKAHITHYEKQRRRMGRPGRHSSETNSESCGIHPGQWRSYHSSAASQLGKCLQISLTAGLEITPTPQVFVLDINKSGKKMNLKINMI